MNCHSGGLTPAAAGATDRPSACATCERRSPSRTELAPPVSPLANPVAGSTDGAAVICPGTELKPTPAPPPAPMPDPLPAPAPLAVPDRRHRDPAPLREPPGRPRRPQPPAAALARQAGTARASPGAAHAGRGASGAVVIVVPEGVPSPVAHLVQQQHDVRAGPDQFERGFRAPRAGSARPRPPGRSARPSAPAPPARWWPGRAARPARRPGWRSGGRCARSRWSCAGHAVAAHDALARCPAAAPRGRGTACRPARCPVASPGWRRGRTGRDARPGPAWR